MFIFGTVFLFLRGLVSNRAQLAMENLALRQQLAILKRTTPRPRIRSWDRVVWVWLARLWAEWRTVLVVVQPETVVRWHRQGFRLYWRWKSRGSSVGRPRVDAEVRANHVGEIAAIDFFTVPTATFRVLFCCLVLRHARRRVVHFHVTIHPTAAWTAQQVVEAFPYDEAPRYLVRDRDAVFAESFRRRVRGMGIHEVRIAPRAPWQNPYVERLIGSMRRECLDHVIILGEAHLRRILSAYFRYYHEARPHLALERNSPVPRVVEPSPQGRILAIPHLVGLHHRYTRAA